MSKKALIAGVWRELPVWVCAVLMLVIGGFMTAKTYYVDQSPSRDGSLATWAFFSIMSIPYVIVAPIAVIRGLLKLMDGEAKGV